MSIKPPPRRRVTKFAIAVVAGAALTLGASNTAADVLRGHLSGLEPEFDRVDLRVRFFDSGRANTALAERRFDDVLLENGDFVVRIDPNAVPAARFVEIALRPSARPYAAFRFIPPRRRLERLLDGTLVAAVHARAEPGNTTTASVGPLPPESTQPGKSE